MTTGDLGGYDVRHVFSERIHLGDRKSPVIYPKTRVGVVLNARYGRYRRYGIVVIVMNQRQTVKAKAHHEHLRA